MQTQEATTAIERFASELKSTIGASLTSTVVYGSLVKGDYDPKTSDHNVSLVLADDHAETLRGIAATMRRARPSKKTNLLLLTREELDNARDVFPLKLRDLSRHHKVVAGDDVMQGLTFDTAHVALDCEQQLRGLVVRVRRVFIRGANDPAELTQNLVGSFKLFLPPMAAVVEGLGKGTPKTKQEVIDAIPATLDVPKEAVDGLRQLMRNPDDTPSAAAANTLLDNYTKILRAAATRADQMGGT